MFPPSPADGNGAHQGIVSYFPCGTIAEGKHAISLSDKYEKYRTYDVMPTGKFIGFLQVADKYEGDFTQDDLQKLTRLALLRWVRKALDEGGTSKQQPHDVPLNAPATDHLRRRLS